MVLTTNESRKSYKKIYCTFKIKELDYGNVKQQ